MHGKWSLASVMLVLLAALALIGATGFLSQRSAGRPANSGHSSAKIATVVIRWFKFEPATVTVHAGEAVEWKNDGFVPHTVTADVLGNLPSIPVKSTPDQHGATSPERKARTTTPAPTIRT